MHEFVIKKSRLKKAKIIVAEKLRELDQNTIYDLMEEISWGESIQAIPKGGKLEFFLTDLQIVGLAAMTLAISEAGAKRKETREDDDKNSIPF